MAGCIVEQVGQHPIQLGPVGQDDRRTDAGELNGGLDPTLDHRPRQRLHVGRHPPDGGLGSVQTGKHQQVGYQGLEPLVIDQRVADGGHQVVDGSRVQGGHLQHCPGGCQGASHLVGGVGDEALLAGRRRLQPCQHVVHGGGKPRNLVGAGRLGHPAVQVGLGDVGHLVGDRTHRAQRPPHQQPGGAGDQQGQQRNPPQEGAPQRLHRVVGRLERCSGQHGEVVARHLGGGRHDHVPIVVLQRDVGEDLGLVVANVGTKLTEGGFVLEVAGGVDHRPLRIEDLGGARFLARIGQWVGEPAGSGEGDHVVGPHPGGHPLGIDEAMANQAGETNRRDDEHQGDHPGGHQRGLGAHRAPPRRPPHGATIWYPAPRTVRIVSVPKGASILRRSALTCTSTTLRSPS